MKSQQERNWYLISSRAKVLGRLATGIARLLMGKHKRDYLPNLDRGDYVVVTDAREVLVTGKKEKQKVYKRYSGFPGGLREIPLERMRREHPERIIENAVRGMLPNNRLKNKRMARLKVFAGSEHPYRDKFKAKSDKQSLSSIKLKV